MIHTPPASRSLTTILIVTAVLLAGCSGPGVRLRFPEHPIEVTGVGRSYDTNGDGIPDFTIRRDKHTLFGAALEYDDDADGNPDRVYRLGDNDPERVPHLIVLIDSIPYEQARAHHQAAAWHWFPEPARVIPPFPTMSALIFSRMLHAPPPRGAINQYYDRHERRRVNRIWQRFTGDGNPWEGRLHYRIGYFGNGNSFLKPRSWFAAELARAKDAFDKSLDRVTIVYLASAAGMLSQFGQEGLDECLAGLEQLTLQVLHERVGAVNVSIVSDHGHNLQPGERIDLAEILRDAGFRPRSSLRPGPDHLDDAVIELDGLVNYFGVHTRRARDLGETLATQAEIELTFWKEGERVVIRSADGEAAIEQVRGRFRYVPVTADVLGYTETIDAMLDAGDADNDGYAAPDTWLAHTAGHHWPDAPTRLWEAFHGLVVSTPDVMAVTTPGSYAGDATFDWWIDMASTHGGLDQQDSAGVLFTTTGRAEDTLRTGAALPTIEPTFDPDRLRHR